jgi:alkylhydroperoxidase family enzyme
MVFNPSSVDDRRMNLHVMPTDDAPVASQPILDGIAADLGFVPNLAAVTAASPTLLAAFDSLRRTVSDPSFSPIHREIAGLAVGVAVDNAYGVAFHSTVLGTLGLDEADIDAMRAGAEPTDAVHAAVYVFARDVVAQRGKVSDDVTRRAHAAGLSDVDLLQLVAECVFAGLVGTVDNLAGRVPLDEFLRPRQWRAFE